MYVLVKIMRTKKNCFIVFLLFSLIHHLNSGQKLINLENNENNKSNIEESPIVKK